MKAFCAMQKKRTFFQTSYELAVLLLVTVFAQTLLTLVRGHLVTLSFLATGHSSLPNDV